MNNSGGILRLWWLDSEYLEGLSDDSLPVLQLASGAQLNAISFAEDGGSLAINETEDDNGPLYGVSITLKIPKVSQANQATMAVVKEALRGRRVILIAEDSNEQFMAIGGSGAYFSVTSSGDLGTVTRDLNHTRMQISADLDQDQVFIADPFLDEGSDS